MRAPLLATVLGAVALFARTGAPANFSLVLASYATNVWRTGLPSRNTLVVGTVTGPGAWTRVTSVTESPATVVITVSSLLIQLGPGTNVGIRIRREAP